jgi:cobalt-zinc-cadmium efflux system outer membrane protein
LLEGRQGVEQLRAQARLEHTRSWGIPALSMGIKRDASQPGHQWVLGVSLPLPLLDRNQGQITQAQHLADQAEALLEARRTELWTTLVNTQEQLRTRLKELDVLNSEVLPLAESAYQAASLGFEKGKFSFLEVLDAQRTLSDVREQVLAARLQAAQASAELERLVGPLLHP